MSDETDIQTPADDEIKRGTHMFLGLCVAAVIGFTVWATNAELDIVSVATGEVAPSTNVQSVDHLEGGIVRTILVKEGDRVVAGQPLIELEQTQSGADVQELKIRLRSLLAEISRLRAELAGKEKPEFPPALVKAEPELVKQAMSMFQSRKNRKLGQVRAQEDAIRQRELEIKEVQARRKIQRQEEAEVVFRPGKKKKACDWPPELQAPSWRQHLFGKKEKEAQHAKQTNQGKRPENLFSAFDDFINNDGPDGDDGFHDEALSRLDARREQLAGSDDDDDDEDDTDWRVSTVF